MNIAGAPETSVNFYQTTRFHIHEDGNVDRYRLEDVKFITDGFKGADCISHTRLVRITQESSFQVPQLFTPSIIIFTNMSLFVLKYNRLLMSFSYSHSV